MCKCGCNSCETKSTALVLKESKFVHTPISDGLKYHIDNQIPLSENIYRIGSKEYMKLYSEARALYSRNKLDVSEDDKYFLTETHVGDFGMFEDKRVPLDIPMISEQMDLEDEIANEEFGMDYDQLGPNEKEWVRDEMDNMSMNENEEYYVTVNRGHGGGKRLVTSAESDYEEPRIFSKEEAKEYIKRVKSGGATPGRIASYWVSDRDMNRIDEKLPFEENLKKIIKEKLCKKGEAYRKRRMAAGEKSSAYLSGRAVKVCKGQMSGKKKKKANENTAPNHDGKAAPYGSGYKVLNIDEIAESLRDWFKKENWVRINTSGNISGDCGTMKKGKATTRCLPKKKAQSLTKAERKATVAKKVRGSKKGKQFVSVNENFEMGDRVKLTPDYEEIPGEVFTITQTSGNKYFIADEDGRGWYTYGDQLVMADDDEYINEAKKKKKKEKKDPPIGKPKRGGSKAYYVYVRDPKTKKVKKVSFGSGGLRAKIRNPKARKAFAARHNCKNKKDRTTAGYWSCNLPKYAKQLGLGANMNTFW